MQTDGCAYYVALLTTVLRNSCDVEEMLVRLINNETDGLYDILHCC